MRSVQGSREVGSETKQKGRVPAQEGTRRGRAAAMRVVAAVHALRFRGTEKCPFEFATDGDSADSENKARVDLLLSFSTADAVDIRIELTRVVRLEADRLVGPVVALAEQNAIDLAPAVVASSHTCKETFRGIAAEGQTADRGAMRVDE